MEQLIGGEWSVGNPFTEKNKVASEDFRDKPQAARRHTDAEEPTCSRLL